MRPQPPGPYDYPDSTSVDALRSRRRHPRPYRRTIIALGLGFLLLTTSIGVAVFVLTRDEAPKTFLEVYLTDRPADVSRLDVEIAAVTVGPDGVPLELDTSSFDLLQHRGPSQALRIARGMVPIADEQEIHIVFASAYAQIDHQTVRLDMPEAVLSLGHDYRLTVGDARSVLFDISVDRSLKFDGPRATFEPFVDSVYVVMQGAVRSGAATTTAPAADTHDRSADQAADFTRVPGEAPRDQRLETEEEAAAYTPPRETPSPSKSPYPDRYQDSTQEPADNDANETGNESNDLDGYTPDPGGSNSVPVDYAQTISGWLVQFAPEADSPEQIQKSVEDAGAEIVYRFGSVPAVYVLGTPVEAINLTEDPYVTYVEPVLPTGFHLSSSKAAIRAPALTASHTAIFDARGNPIDGRGVGVAVVDTGIDGLHPDLTHRQITGADAPLQFNYKAESVILVDNVYTDTTSGHGTHVAGIVAGRGVKDASMKGVAPGATLYGFGIGELSNTFWPNQAFDWILQHGHKQDPPIRVVTNSWGSEGAYDPNSLTTRLVKQMVANDIVVVFSAGNAGGDGYDLKTTRECQIPTTGVLCVAWYDDHDIGTRAGTLALKSSRGLLNDPSTWPDISAPGASVRSARTPFGWVTGIGLTDYYVTLAGTSMAAPHVAGTAALMLQANPDLSPGQVDAIIKATAVKYTHDGAYNAQGTHVGKGHGLIDAYQAVYEAKYT